ncbi:MAG: hypothetical protein ACI35W_00730 [Anaeroplasmataceae bacterium]
MGIFTKLARSVVFHCTEKPKHYVHIDSPKSLQDLRQIQYNNWCKAKSVYNGSYLPKKPDMLLCKGWNEITPKEMKQKKSDERTFQRKSTLQIVRFDDENENQYEHYHWENRKSLKCKIKNDKVFYLDKYGNVTARGSNESHIAPLDKEYIKKK